MGIPGFRASLDDNVDTGGVHYATKIVANANCRQTRVGLVGLERTPLAGMQAGHLVGFKCDHGGRNFRVLATS